LGQIFLDAVLVFSTVVASVIWVGGNGRAVSIAMICAGLLAMGMLGINAGLGFYQRVHSRSLDQSRVRAVMSLLLTVALAYITLRLVPIGQQHQKVLALSVLLGIAVVLVHRVTAAHATPRAMMRQRVLVVGTGTRAQLVGSTLLESDPNVDIVGYYASPNEVGATVSAWGVLSPDKPLGDIVLEKKVDEIVVALADRRGGSMPMRELLDCKLHGVRVLDIAEHFEKSLGQIRLDSVSAGWLIFGDGFRQDMVRTVVKRLFDIVCATILLCLALPVMLITGILIMLDSAGPVLYLQERVGLDGRLFNVVKFRSMRTDAEKDGEPRWACAQDDRTTRVGRVIRKCRIDELPQLFSVLNGDMSLVGPRPERPYFVDKLTREIPYYAVRQSVKPGVTGWAQVRYHYGASVEDSAQKLQYDLYYVKNHTLFLDLVVLFETVGVVLMAKGA
jgi:sugar transferase (PEP-CTERM system associated)